MTRKTFDDLTGKQFGDIVVIKRVENIRRKNSYQSAYLCKCNLCGKEKVYERSFLTRRNSNKRGCSCVGSRFTDITGKRFGRLTVLGIDHVNHRCYWKCKCDCGNETIVDTTNLKSGNTKSCGCYGNDIRKIVHTSHGKSKSRLYRIFNGMKQRCYNENSQKYPIYGARGITICDEWLDNFDKFYHWAMNNGYSDNLTIDRIDVNGNYEPSNCRWATLKQQANNTRRNHRIKCFGILVTMSEFIKRLEIDRSVVYRNMAKGASIEDIALRYYQKDKIIELLGGAE